MQALSGVSSSSLSTSAAAAILDAEIEVTRKCLACVQALRKSLPPLDDTDESVAGDRRWAADPATEGQLRATIERCVATLAEIVRVCPSAHPTWPPESEASIPCSCNIVSRTRRKVAEELRARYGDRGKLPSVAVRPTNSEHRDRGKGVPGRPAPPGDDNLAPPSLRPAASAGESRRSGEKEDGEEGEKRSDQRAAPALTSAEEADAGLGSGMSEAPTVAVSLEAALDVAQRVSPPPKGACNDDDVDVVDVELAPDMHAINTITTTTATTVEVEDVSKDRVPTRRSPEEPQQPTDAGTATGAPDRPEKRSGDPCAAGAGARAGGRARAESGETRDEEPAGANGEDGAASSGGQGRCPAGSSTEAPASEPALEGSGGAGLGCAAWATTLGAEPGGRAGKPAVGQAVTTPTNVGEPDPLDALLYCDEESLSPEKPPTGITPPRGSRTEMEQGSPPRCRTTGCSEAAAHGPRGGRPVWCELHYASQDSGRPLRCSVLGKVGSSEILPCWKETTWAWPGRQPSRCEEHKTMGMVDAATLFKRVFSKVVWPNLAARGWRAVKSASSRYTWYMPPNDIQGKKDFAARVDYFDTRRQVVKHCLQAEEHYGWILSEFLKLSVGMPKGYAHLVTPERKPEPKAPPTSSGGTSSAKARASGDSESAGRKSKITPGSPAAVPASTPDVGANVKISPRRRSKHQHQHHDKQKKKTRAPARAASTMFTHQLFSVNPTGRNDRKRVASGAPPPPAALPPPPAPRGLPKISRGDIALGEKLDEPRPREYKWQRAARLRAEGRDARLVTRAGLVQSTSTMAVFLGRMGLGASPGDPMSALVASLRDFDGLARPGEECSDWQADLAWEGTTSGAQSEPGCDSGEFSVATGLAPGGVGGGGLVSPPSKEETSVAVSEGSLSALAGSGGCSDGGIAEATLEAKVRHGGKEDTDDVDVGCEFGAGSGGSETPGGDIHTALAAGVGQPGLEQALPPPGVSAKSQADVASKTDSKAKAASESPTTDGAPRTTGTGVAAPAPTDTSVDDIHSPPCCQGMLQQPPVGPDAAPAAGLGHGDDDEGRSEGCASPAIGGTNEEPPPRAFDCQASVATPAAKENGGGGGDGGGGGGGGGGELTMPAKRPGDLLQQTQGKRKADHRVEPPSGDASPSPPPLGSSDAVKCLHAGDDSDSSSASTAFLSPQSSTDHHLEETGGNRRVISEGAAAATAAAAAGAASCGASSRTADEGVVGWQS